MSVSNTFIIFSFLALSVISLANDGPAADTSLGINAFNESLHRGRHFIRESTSSDQGSLYNQQDAAPLEGHVVVKRSLERQPTYYKGYEAVVPTVLAAQDLKKFFDTIAYHATSTWPPIVPDQWLFTMTLGPLQLTMSSLTSPMPWSLVVLVANSLSTAAERRFAETFDSYYTDMFTSKTIAISLRLVKEFVPRRLQSKEAPGLALQSQKTQSGQYRSHFRRRATSPGKAILTLSKFTKTTVIVPTLIAAAKLEDFYNIIALKIETGQFAKREPSHFVQLILWDFEFTISCEQMIVPWSFVKAFAIHMADWSAKEFTGFYEATVIGDGALKGLSFFVRMGSKTEDPFPLRAV